MSENPPFLADRRVLLSGLTPALQALLAQLLRQWGYAPELHPGPALQISLFESPTGRGMRLAARDWQQTLSFPFSVETLWLLLQRIFFDPPREHLRLTLSLRGTLRHPEFSEPFYTVSLSDAGTRLRAGRELLKGETLTAELHLPDETLVIPSEVIYSFPSRTGYSLTTGISFDPAAARERILIREFLVISTLQQASAALDPATFATALSSLDLPHRVRQRFNPIG